MTVAETAIGAAIAVLLLSCGGTDGQCANGLTARSSAMSTRGTFSVTSYVLPHPGLIHDAAVDSAGHVWYAAQSTGCIGELDPATGSVRERSAVSLGGSLHGLAWDASGQGLWHGADAGFLVLTRSDGRTQRIPLRDTGRVHSVAVADGIVWFTTDRGTGFHDTRSGRTVTHAAPGAPYDIAAAPGGGAWFSIPNGPAIGRYAPGPFEPPDVFLLPSGSEPLRLAVDAAGTVWFTDYKSGRVGAWAVEGDSARWFALPDGMSFPRGIAATSDGSIWYYSDSAGQIVRLNPEDGWTDRVAIPVMGRHLTVDHRHGILWVAGGSGLAAIHFQISAIDGPISWR